MELLAQGFGIVGMCFNILSYQMKKQRHLILMQLFGGLFFLLNFALLGAWTGMLMNGVSVIRAAVYADKEKFKTDRPVWLVGFIAVYLLCYVLTFTAFGKEPTAVNLLVEFLPVMAMTAANIGFCRKEARDVRRLAMIVSPAWLIYDSINLSIGGIVCEVICIVSAIVGMIRYDFKKEKPV